MSRVTQDALLEQLKAPFDPKFVKWRIGQVNKKGDKATAFAYLDAREIYKRLDDVCGVGGWQDRVTELNKGGFIGEIGILIDGQWVWKSDAADFTDMEAIKGGASSAIKRAAAVWGIGRYLYYMPTVWVKTKVLYTKKNGDPAYGIDGVPELPKWAVPNKDIPRWEDVAENELEDNPEIEPVFDGKTQMDYEIEIAALNSGKDIIAYMKDMSMDEKRAIQPLVEKRVEELNAERESKSDARG